jgi:hypothetical protein
MKKFVSLFAASLVLAGLFNLTSGRSAVSAPAPAEARPVVQIAILLDTSGSMSGLIDQAKSQLWRIVNEFIKARQNGAAPEVQVALFEYGNDGLSPAQGWIRLIAPLSTDLDKLSEELFALKTNGGTECCGWVIKEAVEQLAWSKSPNVYKTIFIAGNEPFTQGSVDFRQSCKTAIEHGIIVNTIHCGTEAEGISGKWNEGALLAEGKYLVIDHNRAVVHFEAPQDKEIARLGAELSKTYVAYGRAGQASAERQAAQDASSVRFSFAGAPVERALTKASANYRNESWDLVDALQKNGAKLSEVKRDELPAEMQKLSDAERKTFVETKAKERGELQAKITQLNAERSKYVADQMKKPAGATNTLDAVMITTIREQAQKRNFKFE